MKLSHFASVVVLLAASLVEPAPLVRMRTGEATTNWVAARQRRDDAPQSITCTVRNLEEALIHVNIEHEFEGFSCPTLTHENIHVLLNKLEALVEFTLTEEVFGNLTFPNHVYHLLQVMNHTLPSVVAHVGNVTESESYSSQDVGASLECVSEFCSQHCGVCRANCELHRLKTGVEDLVGLLEADYVSQCDVCVDTAVQRESVEMRGVLESVGDELIPSTPLLCVQMVLLQLPDCQQPLNLLERLENLTTAMNNTLTPLNGSRSFSNLQLVVERLTSSILPDTRVSLESLEARGCPTLSEFITETECEPVSSTLIAEEVANQLPGSGCGLEQELVAGMRTLNLLRYNYSHLVQRIQFLGLL